MLQTLARTASAVVFAALLLPAAPAYANDALLVVRVYDMATSNAAARAAALRTAADAIASAGVRVQWRDCSRGGAAHPCKTVRDAGDLVVRIMPIAARATTTEEVELGFAPIDPAGRATVIATVYYDVVERVARRTGIPANELLGRAMAHEIGHLLLRAPGHAPSGLMRPLWTDDELVRNHPDDWTFSDADRQHLQTVARDPDPAVWPGTGEVEATGR